MKKMLELVRRGFEVEYNGWDLSYNTLASVYIARKGNRIVQRRNANVFAEVIKQD